MDGRSDTLENLAEPTIPYATPSPRRGSPVMAGSAILLAGLGLVFLGGCFLVGVLIVTEAGRENAMQGLGGMTTPMVVLLCVLYVLAFACFAGALTLLFIGTRALLRLFK
jgi:hypothetical protein